MQGWGGEALLDSYDAERRPVFASTIDDFIAKAIETDRQFLATHSPERDADDFKAAWQARASGAVGEVHAFEPNYEGSPVIVDGVGRASAAPGVHIASRRAPAITWHRPGSRRVAMCTSSWAMATHCWPSVRRTARWRPCARRRRRSSCR